MRFFVTLFLGMFGVHKFLDKKYGMGILYLCTFGLFGIGWIIDIVRAGMDCAKSKKQSTVYILSRTSPKPSTAPVVPATTTHSVHLRTFKELSSLQDFIVLDTETTGLSPYSDRVIEVGAITVAGGQEVAVYSTLINPLCSIPARASAVNHIYDSTVASAPTMADVAADLKQLVDGKLILGYNVGFDARFIKAELERHGMATEFEYLDILPIIKQVYPELPNHKLKTISAHLGLDTQTHRAADDAAMTLNVFRLTLQKMRNDAAVEAAAKKVKKEADAKLRAERHALSPMLNKTVAFTGDFSTDRNKLEEMLASVGALLRQSVTSKTDYLVVGDLTDLPDFALERKSYKADQMIAQGGKIQKITELEYLALIKTALAALK